MEQYTGNNNNDWYYDKGLYPKLVEVAFFNEGANDFLMNFYRAREADCFTS